MPNLREEIKKKPIYTPTTATSFSTAGIHDELEFGNIATFGGEIEGKSKGGYFSQVLEISAAFLEEL